MSSSLHYEVLLPSVACGSTALASAQYRVACFESGGTAALAAQGNGTHSLAELAGFAGIFKSDTVAAGNPVDIWGIGSVIPAIVKGTAISIGEYLEIDATAAAANRARLCTATNGCYAVAIAMEATTTDGTILVVKIIHPTIYADISLVGIGNA